MRILVCLLLLLSMTPPGYGQRARSWVSGVFIEASGTSVARTMRQEDRDFVATGAGVSGRIGYGPVPFLAVYAGAGRATLRESNDQRTRHIGVDGGLVASLPRPIARITPFATLTATRHWTHAEAQDLSSGAAVPVTFHERGIAAGLGVRVRVAGPLSLTVSGERTSGRITEVDVGGSRSGATDVRTHGYRLRAGLALLPGR